MRDISPDLMDIHGAASTLPFGTDGAADDGSAEYVYRFAPLAGIYGGTLEVFRNMIGAVRAWAGQAQLLTAGEEGLLILSPALNRRRCRPCGVELPAAASLVVSYEFRAVRVMTLREYPRGIMVYIGQ